MRSFGASSFYPIIKERWKNATMVHNESQATSLAGYEIKFPSKILFDSNLQFGVVETAPDDAKFVLLFYSKEPLTDSTRFNEFFKQNGIWIAYRRWTSSSQEGSFDFNIPNYIRTFKKEGRDGYEITINGHKGMASSQRDRLFHGVDIHDPSQVEFMIKETHITIQGYLEKDDLIKIAESIK
ncbi:MAG: DUF4367 domain-containing protein [Nitrosotalea sp.]